MLPRSLSSLLVLLVLAGPLGAQGSTTSPPVRVPVKSGPTGGPDLSKLPKTPKVPVTFEGLFAERDARATDAMGYLRCLQETVNALRAGALGMVPRDWSMTCVRQGSEWRGVFGSLRDGTIDVKLQYALRGTRKMLTTDRVDTARVNGTARALLRGLSAPLPGAGKYEFIPIPLAQSQFVEVWFLPVPGTPSQAIVGGDSLIQMSTDGMRELGHGRNTPPIRVLTVPVSGTTWTMPSLEERIPTVSELVVAHMALDLVPEVRVQTRQYESVLARGRGWTHRRR
jgi:hypothetical protein